MSKRQAGDEQERPQGAVEGLGPLVRVPGLYERWELADVVEPGTEYFFVDAGCDSKGRQLIQIYKRPAVRAVA